MHSKRYETKLHACFLAEYTQPKKKSAVTFEAGEEISHPKAFFSNASFIHRKS